MPKILSCTRCCKACCLMVHWRHMCRPTSNDWSAVATHRVRASVVLAAVAHFAHWMPLCWLPADRLNESRIDQFLQEHLPHCGRRGPVMRHPREYMLR